MWPTPTPIPTTTVPNPLPIDPTAFTATFTEWILQGWSKFDSNPFATVVWFIAVALIIFAGIMSIRRHLEKL